MKTLVLLVAGTALLVSLLMLTRKTEDTQHHLQKKWSHDNTHLKDMDKEHNYPWMNNAWYRYVYDRVHAERNITDCYVCSHMPTTALHATVYGKAPTMSEALCIYDKAITGNCLTPGNPVMVIGGSIKDQSRETCANATRHIVPRSVKAFIYNITNCTQEYPNNNYTCNAAYWVHVNVSHKQLKSFSVVLPPDMQHPVCFNFTGETGWSGTPQGLKKLGKNKNCSVILTAPDWHGNGSSTGTYWVQGAAWACGQKTYFMLPPNSTGLCAPVLVSDHTFKITPEASGRKCRDTADIQSHDSVWGTDVPEESKLWTTGQKVLHSLFPWVGTGKNMLRIETLDYRFGLFLNASTKINKAQNEEIDAVRITVMQHRVALDMILAEKRGLCVLFNTTCCTYIPDDVHSPNMTATLNTLKQLRNVQQQDYVTSTDDWWTWLLSGPWKSLLIKGLIAIGLLLLLLCIFATCIIPCLKNMISNMVTASINAYVTLPQMDPDDEDQSTV